MRRPLHFCPIGVRAVTLAILFLGSAASLSASDKITINVRQSNDAIRRQLLGVTPLGTPIHAVYQFLESRLHRDSRVVGGPEEPHPFTGGLDTELGHYREPRSFAEGASCFQPLSKHSGTSTSAISCATSECEDSSEDSSNGRSAGLAHARVIPSEAEGSRYAGLNSFVFEVALAFKGFGVFVLA